MTEPNRILLISYHFPPSAAVGGQRIVNFATSLSALGWEPEVLTIADGNIEQVDEGRLRAVGRLPVHKARVLPTLAGLYGAFARRARATASESAGAASVPAIMPAAAAVPAAKTRESLTRRLRRYLFSFLLLPDHERGWILPAAIKASRVIRHNRIGWFLTSCPPYSVHLVGLIVKTLTGAKWIVDYRDPWMTTGSKRLYPTSALSIRIESWLERKVIERADLIVFNVERLKEAYRRRYAHVPAEKFIALPNGIVADQIPDRTGLVKFSPFTLSYTGALYVGRSPEPIFKAVARLIQQGAVGKDDVRIKLVGHCRVIEGVPTASVVHRYGLESVVEVRDSVSQKEAADIITRSQLALLFAPNLQYQIPAKVYDYLATGTRILAIAEDGGTADLIKDTDAGLAFSPDDVDGITGFIHREMTAPSTMNGRYAAAMAQLDAKVVTERLVQHLTRIDGGRQS